MKKILSSALVFAILFCLASCRKMPSQESSGGEISVINEVVYAESIQNQTKQETSKPEVKTYESTIATPKQVYFYKDGMYGVSEDAAFNHKIAKYIESWYTDYEVETLPFTNSAASEELIADIKCNEMAIEICFDNDYQINLLGKIKLAENADRLLIPLTSEFAYYILIGRDQYLYNGGQYTLGGSGLERYFDGITFDKKVEDWQTTVAAPTKVTFYKDGLQSVSTDKELNLKIARHIEEWFKYQTTLSSCNCIHYTSDIEKRKRSETAIQLDFDQQIEFYGGFIYKDERTLFISLDGDSAYDIFTGDPYSELWGNIGVYCENRNLEQFFTDRQYEPIPNDQWQSTVIPPATIQLYKNGEMLREYTDKDFNHKVAQYIEQLYLYKTEIELADVPNYTETIDNIRDNETYIEMFFSGDFICKTHITLQKSSNPQ